MSKTKYLLDLNVLISLVDEDHVSHTRVKRWFQSQSMSGWYICPLTESGFVRIVTNPKYSDPSISITEALEMLRALSKLPGYHYLPISAPWLEVVAPFAERLFGHQQVADSYLLGLAIKEQAVLVTMDKAIKSLAGPQLQRHMLLLA